MHFKFYETVDQIDKNIKKIIIPKSHPSYMKDPVPNINLSLSARKKIDFLQSSFNFLKG
jgi:hypothetical protein